MDLKALAGIALTLVSVLAYFTTDILSSIPMFGVMIALSIAISRRDICGRSSTTDNGNSNR